MSLVAENIACKRNARLLFEGVSFHLLPGELLQITGANGSGKTSLLRIAGGLLKPHTGAIGWNNVCIDSSHDYCQQLFYVGHALALRSELSVHENLRYSLDFFSDKQMQETLTHWQLNTVLHQPCGALSQGQQQRVALARLQLAAKKCWILDEPFSNLDAEGVAQLEWLLEQHLSNEGIVLLSSHREIKVRTIKHKVLAL